MLSVHTGRETVIVILPTRHISGVLMVMNKGPDYNDIASNPLPSVCLRTQTRDILYPMQAQGMY